MSEAHDRNQGPLSGEWFFGTRYESWLKKAKLEKLSWRKNVNNNLTKEILLQGSLITCFDLEESKPISNKYTVYLRSLSSKWARQTEQTRRQTRRTLPSTSLAGAWQSEVSDTKDIMVWTVTCMLPGNKEKTTASWVTRMTGWGQGKTPKEICQRGNFSSLSRY